MSETTSNVEMALSIHEHGHRHGSASSRWVTWVEITEAVALATVAIATAWSGYQAAKWDALSTRNYALGLQATVLSQEQATLSGQDRLDDLVEFNGWVAAKTAGNEALAAFYVRRFRADYATAFAAWEKLDPFNNPAAPADPMSMPEYRNQEAQESAKLTAEAGERFEAGVATRETGDAYVKVTVFLATVLLLTALSQRFTVFGPRVAVLAVAFVLLMASSYWLFTFPRA
jgi:hypothetical protein